MQLSKEEFDCMCAALPDGMHWGDPLTPDAVRHIVSALRAQADARPVAAQQIPTPDQLRAIAREARNTAAPSDEPGREAYVLAGWRAAMAAHPEASAPGLSDDWSLLQEAFRFGQFADDFDEPLAKPLRAAIRAILTRASAATVGEPSKTAAVPVELMGVKEANEEGGGQWRTCTGCYESEDGHPVGRYYYSEVMGCTLGGGCAECGGIGAVWDTTDYNAMAEHFMKLEEAEEAAQQQAEPGTDERAAFNAEADFLARLIENSQYGLQFGDGSLRKGRALTQAEMRIIVNALRCAAQSGQLVGWYENLQAECTRDHGPYSEDAPLAERLRWWVPSSSKHGSTTLEDDLKEAAEQSGQRAGVAEEWVLVPKKITNSMIYAASDVPSGIAGSPPHWQHVWDALLAAAPKPTGSGSAD